MCGLAGLLSKNRVDPALLVRMEQAIAHRGPDDSGIWCEDHGVGLAHRRLSIVDLSPLGHQPMSSNDGRWVLAFNGEIYNHLDLRRSLSDQAPVQWRGHSDTETLVACISAWGLARALEQSVGMFALALWDRRERRLHLARDRFGEKPLYYGWVGGDFVFGSELKAIRRHPRFDNSVSRRALRAYTARAYVPAPLSIFENIYKLEPGCILTADDGAWRPASPPAVGETSGGVRIERYWSYRDVLQQGLADPIGDPEQAVEELEAALARTIAGQAVADVPVGAFLSGGIDSSTVVALYQAHSPGRVKTFSIGFEEAGFDEAVYAKQVARHFGTEHHESYVSSRDALDVIPSLPTMYDEPFGDSSQIPTHLVSRMARQHVTVALSGDGGDELFGGYNRYIATDRLWSRLKQVPRPMRAAAGGGMALVPPGVWNAAATLLPSGRRPAFFGARVQKAFRTVRDARSFDDLAVGFLDDWAGASPVLIPDAAAPAHRFDMNVGAPAPDVTRMMYGDAVSYLPDDILCKVDRAGMAVSLETRIPFLDHNVAAVAARIPAAMNVRNGTGKLILRRLLYKHAPRALFERPKAGFAVPVGEWLKGPLRDWAEELLRPERLRSEGFFDHEVIGQRWRAHVTGGRDATQPLWAVLMFQAWLAENRLGSAGADSREFGSAA